MIIDNQMFVYYDNVGTFTDFTRENASATKTVDFDLSATKILYLGKEHTFNYRYLNFKTPQSGATITIEYTNSSGLQAVELLVDNTYDFSENGHIYFALPEDWKKSTVDSKELYWLKITSSVEVTGYEIYGIKNLFADDNMVRDYLPELDRYLPTGKSDFLYLHELAKNEIINDIKASSKIDYEDQIKGDSLIVLQQLGCYKFLDLLLLPMIEDESIKTMYGTYKSLYAERLDSIRLSVDKNKSETISTGETSSVNFATISRY